MLCKYKKGILPLGVIDLAKSYTFGNRLIIWQILYPVVKGILFSKFSRSI